MTSSEMPYRFEDDQGRSIVVLLPELNNVQWAEIEQIGTNVLARLNSVDAPGFIFDLTKLNYMGSAMVALIVRVWKVVKERNARMVVVCNDAMVLEVLRLAGLTKVWTVVDSRSEAFRHLGGSRLSRSADGDNLAGLIPNLFGLVAVMGAVVGLTLLLGGSQAVDSRVALAVALGGSGIGLVLGTISVVRADGLPRVLGYVVIALALGIGLTSVVNLPMGGAAPPTEASGGEASEEADTNQAGDAPAAGETAANNGGTDAT